MTRQGLLHDSKPVTYLITLRGERLEVVADYGCIFSGTGSIGMFCSILNEDKNAAVL